MTKRYRERLEEVELAADAPAAFSWRGQRYQVLQVLGHWREDPGWWRRPDGAPVRIDQADLWRVEAGRRNGRPPGPRTDLRPDRRNGAVHGVYELVRKGDEWRLHRVWD